LPETASDATETPAVHDDEAIVGFWRGIDALTDGDPSANDIGAIYEFRCDNPLWIVSSEYEGLQEYRMDCANAASNAGEVVLGTGEIRFRDLSIFSELTGSGQLSSGDVIHTQFHDGTITSVVQKE
jgi:hypothetical protein